MKGAVERKACGPFCLSPRSHWREMAMRVFGVALIGLLSLAPLASVSGTQALSNAPGGVDASRLEGTSDKCASRPACPSRELENFPSAGSLRFQRPGQSL